MSQDSPHTRTEDGSLAEGPGSAVRAPRQAPHAFDISFSSLCLLLGCLLLLSIRAIASSLWLDETSTYWVVKDGFGDMLARAWEWCNQSPLYYFTAWLARPLAPLLGLEPSLRLPSALAAFVAALFVFKVGRRLADAKVGLLGSIAFLCLPEVSFAASDARPYALALALLAASMYYFLAWLETGSRRHAALYVLCTALVVYAHYLFALGLAAQVFYGFRRDRRIVLLWLAAGVLCLPLLAPLLQLFETRRAHSFEAAPGALATLYAFVPFVPAMAVAAALLLRPLRPQKNPLRVEYKIPHALLGAWFLFPPLFLFLVSVLTDVRLFIPRYYLSDAPALALLTGYALARLSPLGIASACLIVVSTLFTWQPVPMHGEQDWRGALGAVNRLAARGDVVLLPSGLVEATPEALRRHALDDLLFTQLPAYPVTQAEVVRLPYDFNEPAASAALKHHAAAGRIFLVALRTNGGLRYADWLKDKLAENYPLKVIEGYPQPFVQEYTRAAVKKR